MLRHGVVPGLPNGVAAARCATSVRSLGVRSMSLAIEHPGLPVLVASLPRSGHRIARTRSTFPILPPAARRACRLRALAACGSTPSTAPAPSLPTPTAFRSGRSSNLVAGRSSRPPRAFTAQGGPSGCKGVCSAWATLHALSAPFGSRGLSTAVHALVPTVPKGRSTLPAGDAV